MNSEENLRMHLSLWNMLYVTVWITFLSRTYNIVTTIIDPIEVVMLGFTFLLSIHFWRKDAIKPTPRIALRNWRSFAIGVTFIMTLSAFGMAVSEPRYYLSLAASLYFVRALWYLSSLREVGDRIERIAARLIVISHSIIAMILGSFSIIYLGESLVHADFGFGRTFAPAVVWIVISVVLSGELSNFLTIRILRMLSIQDDSENREKKIRKRISNRKQR